MEVKRSLFCALKAVIKLMDGVSYNCWHVKTEEIRQANPAVCEGSWLLQTTVSFQTNYLRLGDWLPVSKTLLQGFGKGDTGDGWQRGW